MQARVFISDLHLHPDKPQITERCVQFLDWLEQFETELYIVGDLFDAWIGDDALHPAFVPLLTKLSRRTTKNLTTFIMHGNRDFLLGELFCKQTGCRLLADPEHIQIRNQSILICHGDTLCTDDVDYQRFRLQIREPSFIQSFLKKTVPERLQFAAKLRQDSQSAVAEKNYAIMDVNQSFVENYMLQHQVFQLIHGHTHRLAIHRFTLQNQPATRAVLGDWSNENGNYLWADTERFVIYEFPSHLILAR